ncbi:MAG TPA: hypothetical protein VI454_15855 [Verrucomicrobiae bacterium]
MGYYCMLEQPIEGVDPLSVDGKALAHAHFHSQSSPAHADSPLAALDDFFSVNPEDALAFAQDAGIDVADMAPPPVKWIDAGAGLKLIRGLLANFRESDCSISLPDSPPNLRERVVTDLEGIEAVLRIAAERGVRFYLTCDTP